MKHGHVGERMRGYLHAHAIQQKAVAIAAGTDQASLSRRLDEAEPDPWYCFLLGVAVGRLNRSNGPQIRPKAA